MCAKKTSRDSRQQLRNQTRKACAPAVLLRLFQAFLAGTFWPDPNKAMNSSRWKKAAKKVGNSSVWKNQIVLRANSIDRTAE
mmetsp:Transcript_3688/g.8528  ORF Transcript_3688/g.8528 Transcript_3688/m.8528 type:complete len:82 (-) Transcript_3688:1218-1463(-)